MPVINSEQIDSHNIFRFTVSNQKKSIIFAGSKREVIFKSHFLI
jgi:hypothetical protein